MRRTADPFPGGSIPSLGLGPLLPGGTSEGPRESRRTPGDFDSTAREPRVPFSGGIPFSTPTRVPPMYYTTYRWGLIAMTASVIAVVGALALFISLVWGIVLLVVLASVSALGLWFRFTLMEGAMAETGGVSANPWFDVVDDRDPKVLEAYNQGERPRFPDEESDSVGEPGSCPFCGARVSRPGARYCDDCGKPLRPP